MLKADSAVHSMGLRPVHVVRVDVTSFVNRPNVSLTVEL